MSLTFSSKVSVAGPTGAVKVGFSAVCEVAWGMTTDADIQLDGNKAVLKQAGKELRAKILSPSGATFLVESAAHPPPQKPNKGVKRLMIRLKEQKDNVRIAVLLSPIWPDGNGTKPPRLKPLVEW